MIYHKQSLRLKLVNFGFLIIVFNFSFLIFSLTTARGQTMSNDKYIIQNQDIDTNPSATKYPTPPQENSIDKPPNPNPFTFSISQDLIDFGHLTPTTPITRILDLSIINIPPSGYSVLAFESSPLKTENSFIPDTTCDNGACNELKSSTWESVLTYGFGYHCNNLIGFDCERSFSNLTLYKQFADISNSENPQPVMRGINPKNKEVRIFYKLNISGNQPTDSYKNTITYIAVPNF